MNSWSGYQAGAAYWWQNTRATVLFEPAIRRMLEDGYTHFVELGPHPVLAASIFETAGKQRVSVMATQRRDHDDSRALLNCVGALHCNGHDVAWNVVHPRDGGRLLKLPSYPWQTKRFWNETQEAAEALFYDPVHPLLGQSVSALHPTWEAELSTVLNAFLADHRVQGSVVVPGAVYVEMALAAANAIYGSNHSVDNLVLHRAVILDETCDPILRTTLNEDDGTLEFAAFTATADGDSKWTITATAELNTLPPAPRRHDPPDGAEPVTSIGGDDFYARTQAIGFDYGDAFRSVQSVTAGEDWAVAEIAVPAAIADELDRLPIPSGAHRRRLPNALRRTISRAGGERGPVPPDPDPPLRGLRCTRRTHDGFTFASCRRPAKRSRATSRSPTAPGDRSPSSTASRCSR